jgi:hypothetical protein
MHFSHRCDRHRNLPLPNVLACQQHWLICRLAGPCTTSYWGETPGRWEGTWLVGDVSSHTLHDETWLRGAWPTDQNGVAQFTMSVLDTASVEDVHTKVFLEWQSSSNRAFLVHTIFFRRRHQQVDKVHIPLLLVAIHDESHPRYRRPHAQLA